MTKVYYHPGTKTYMSADECIVADVNTELDDHEIIELLDAQARKSYDAWISVNLMVEARNSNEAREKMKKIIEDIAFDYDPEFSVF